MSNPSSPNSPPYVRRMTGGAIISLALALTGFADVAKTWTPSDLGYTVSETTRAGLVVTVHPLTGCG
jgi:hypothetical protein